MHPTKINKCWFDFVNTWPNPKPCTLAQLLRIEEEGAYAGLVGGSPVGEGRTKGGAGDKPDDCEDEDDAGAGDGGQAAQQQATSRVVRMLNPR